MFTTVAHKINAAREPIGIVEKRQRYFDMCEYQCTICILLENLSWI